jgi:hypothetical protein
MSWLEALPAIGTFLSGPAGSIAGAGLEWLAGKFGASDKTVEAIKQRLDGYSSDQLVQLKQIDDDFHKFCMENSIKLQLAQVAVDQEEAKSVNWFVAGWRPACGWVGAIGLLYIAFIEPLMRFIAKMNGYNGEFPEIDTQITFQVLSGMLGISVMRTVEKVKNAEGNR